MLYVVCTRIKSRWVIPWRLDSVRGPKARATTWSDYLHYPFLYSPIIPRLLRTFNTFALFSFQYYYYLSFSLNGKCYTLLFMSYYPIHCEIINDTVSHASSFFLCYRAKEMKNRFPIVLRTGLETTDDDDK